MDMDLFSKLILVKRQMEDYEERGINRYFTIFVFAGSFRFSSQKIFFLVKWKWICHGKCFFKTNEMSDCNEYQITRNAGLIKGRTKVNETLDRSFVEYSLILEMYETKSSNFLLVLLIYQKYFLIFPTVSECDQGLNLDPK